MSASQPGILLDVPAACRYLTFSLAPGADPREALEKLQAYGVDKGMVVGLGQSVVSSLGQTVEGLRPFPAISCCPWDCLPSGWAPLRPSAWLS